MKDQRQELVLLRQLEREVLAHFIAPYLPEHLDAAHRIIIELKTLRVAASMTMDESEQAERIADAL